jgi:hypothetical protein
VLDDAADRRRYLRMVDADPGAEQVPVGRIRVLQRLDAVGQGVGDPPERARDLVQIRLGVADRGPGLHLHDDRYRCRARHGRERQDVPSDMRMRHPQARVAPHLAPRDSTVRKGDFGEFLTAALHSGRMGDIVPLEKLSTKPVDGRAPTTAAEVMGPSAGASPGTRPGPPGPVGRRRAGDPD